MEDALIVLNHISFQMINKPVAENQIALLTHQILCSFTEMEHAEIAQQIKLFWEETKETVATVAPVTHIWTSEVVFVHNVETKLLWTSEEMDAIMLFATADKSSDKVEEMLVDRTKTAQLHLYVQTAQTTKELKIITKCAVLTHVLKLQGEVLLELMVLATDVMTMRSSSMGNARDQYALQPDTTFLKMVTVFNAKDTKM